MHSNLIDGEKLRNAYWQACVDITGVVHISWVWRESANVASNHDICYTRSADGGETWTNSKNEKYNLPITAATAEYVCTIPQGSELINQTSMVADDAGNPFIATYWKEKNETVPQYHIVFKKDSKWQIKNLGFRTTTFSLNGVGTKKIPVSRPQIICWKNNGTDTVAIIFRDEERSNKVSVATCIDLKNNKWIIDDLTQTSVGSWEPSFDTELWKQKKVLHLFVQKTEQLDGEGKANIPQQMVEVLEWNPLE